MAIAKPRSQEEQAVVNGRLRKKYPQMFTKEWKEAVAKEEKKRRKKAMQNESPVGLSNEIRKVKKARKSQKSSLEDALTGDEIKRLIGR